MELFRVSRKSVVFPETLAGVEGSKLDANNGPCMAGVLLILVDIMHEVPLSPALLSLEGALAGRLKEEGIPAEPFN